MMTQILKVYTIDMRMSRSDHFTKWAMPNSHVQGTT